MNESSTPSVSSAHTRSASAQQRRLPSTRPVLTTIHTADGLLDSSDLHSHLDGGAAHRDGDTGSHNAFADPPGIARGLPTSASSTSISPISTGNRMIRRRGSSRSSSFASTIDAADGIFQDMHTHLSPQHASSKSLGAIAADGDEPITHNHNRDTSVDITGRGMLAHSRDNSNTSGIIQYTSSSMPDGHLGPRPPSTSAWSSFSLGREYGLDDTSSIDVGRAEQDEHPDPSEYDDAVYLSESWSSRPNAVQQQGSSLNEALNLAPADPCDTNSRLGRGISRRAKGTEGYYRYPQNVSPASEGLKRQRSIIAGVERGLRKMSVRVVNLAQIENNEHVPLSGDTEEAAKGEALHPEAKNEAGNEVLEESGLPLRQNPATLQGGSLQGRSLGVFGPDSQIRKVAQKVFLWRWTEPMLLVLIVANVVVLTIQSARDIYQYPRSKTAGYFRTWEDYALFVIFVAFTLEVMARILVCGFMFNAEESRHTRTYRERYDRLRARINGQPVHAPVMQRSNSSSRSGIEVSQTGLWDYPPTENIKNSEFRKAVICPGGHVSCAPSTEDSCNEENTMAVVEETNAPLSAHEKRGVRVYQDVPFVHALLTQRSKTLTASTQSAFLRHSWNRIDLLAVLAFWIMFILASTGAESRHTLYIFRGLAALRSARLLTVTNGTATILRSLKQSAPLMVSVALFVIFAMALFSIIGVYSFKGSFQRSCVWIDPAGRENVTLAGQRCGGHINASTGASSTYIPQGGYGPAIGGPKGYICPVGQLCMDIGNPYNGTQSFDNVFAALLQVVIITGANGWADLMYDMVDAEYFASCLFFIVCLVLLNFWLMNIFVAVIINTFGNIREETKHSAFAGRSRTNALDKEASRISKEGRSFSTIWRRRIAFVSKWCWTAAIVADVGVQASKTADDTPERIAWLNQAELYFTLAFLVEIVSRFMSYLPNYRKFTRRTRNRMDTFLAIVTTSIQIPAIRRSAVYPWLTVFQLMRFYRVILAVPRMKALLAKVLSSVAGLVNMILFLLLMNFIVAVVAVQFLRGQIPQEVDGETVQYSFYQIYNAFLAIYVVFSSENWPDILYNATSAEALDGQAWISAIFIAGWFLFANFILLQMFIAVINEGFAIAEEEKHKAQLQAYVKQCQPQAPTANWISRINPYRFVKARPGILSVENLPTNLALPIGQPTLPTYMTRMQQQRADTGPAFSQEASGTFISSLKRVAAKKTRAAPASLGASTGNNGEAKIDGIPEPHYDTIRQLELLSFYKKHRPHTGQEAEAKRRAEQVEFIAGHPSYDRSLWVFSPRNPIRRLCQRLVEPSYGERLYGVKPYRTWVAAFKLLILCAIIGSVVIAAVATPLYRREYYIEYGHLRLTWFNLTEVSLGFIFVIEFIVKVVADGFVFTPNAYLLSVWNILDFCILIILLINVGAALSPSSIATSRITRSLKAFRALRLINLSETMRQTFYNVMIIGASLIFDASVLTLLYIIPFSVWGQNLFSGLLYSCNDGDVLGKVQCIGEFTTSPAGWEILVPRAWQNPYVWSFDSFRSAILILFEIVSLEGWVDVMDSAMAITSRDQQNQPDSSQYNSIFFLVYNLIGAIVVLTLFVSVIIENFSLRSGQALLTSEQQQWVDLKKLLVRQRPSRRPEEKPTGAFRSWCYDRAIAKHGWWSRLITALYVVHVGVLASQTESQAGRVDDSRDYVFLVLTLMYLANIVIMATGLGVKNFCSNGWNVFDVFSVMGTLATTIPLLLRQQSQIATQLQKLFLVCICFKLVQRNNSLNRLFKTASASLPAILNVFGLWLTLFLVWAIMFLEVFSLTRWQENETWMQNYATFPRAMVMLSFMSVGEGWNAYMHDYATEYPYCSSSDSYLFDDCGNAAGAFVLFITWNVISMYIFANMLTGVVVENFSFVFSLYGKTTALSRDEMRIYKKMWSTFDTRRTGYLQRKDIVPFLSRLSGIFDVTIYPPEFQVKALISRCSIEGSVEVQPERAIDGLNLDALNGALQAMDPAEIKGRKRQLNRLYHEALLCCTSDKGISFTDMLLMLAQYKLVQPETALKFEETLEYAARQQMVDDLISLERVKGRMQTIFLRRAFLAHRASKGITGASVPQIILPERLGDQTGNSVNYSTARPHLGIHSVITGLNEVEISGTGSFDNGGLLHPRSPTASERQSRQSRTT